MMYGFGDDQNPYTESVDLLEDLVIEFITEMVCKFSFDFALYYLPTITYTNALFYFVVDTQGYGNR